MVLDLFSRYVVGWLVAEFESTALAKRLWRVLRHCGVPDDDLDDAVQETFLVVFRRLPQFEAKASLRTWIYAVAVRVASTRRRARRRELARRERAGAQMHGSSSLDPETELGRAEAAALVDRLLDELDPPKRTVFVLAEIEGVKVPEISKILGVNPRTVHSRLRLARERFSTSLRRVHAREQGNLRVARLRPRAVLQAAADDRPSPRRRKAAAAALMVRLEQGAMPTLAGWESVALSSTGGWTGMATVAAVAGAAALAIAFVATRPEPASASADRERATPAAPKESPTSQATARARAEAPPLEPEAPEPETTTPTQPDASPTTAPTRAGRGASSPTVDDPSRPAPSTASSPSTLAEETRLLELARAALRREDGPAALVALDDHLHRFPAGLLADEARSTRLRALCMDGRDEAARAYAEQLSPGPKTSRWDEIVTAACGRPAAAR